MTGVFVRPFLPAVLATTVLAGCGVLPALHVDLAQMSRNSRICVPTKPGEPVYFGFFIGTDNTITIDDVSLVDNQGLQILGTFLVPIRQFPPGHTNWSGGVVRDPLKNRGWEWDKAVPAVGQTLTPTSPETNLVVEMATTTGGKATALRVDYRRGGAKMYAVMDQGTIIKARPDKCL